MPAGVSVVIENGFATIDFVDPKLKGPGLSKLLKVTPPELVMKRTGVGPRAAVYVVPESYARLAGLHDEPAESATPDEPATPEVKHGYDDGKPDGDWSRAALNEYAANLGLDPAEYKNAALILAAIRAKEAENTA